MILDILYQDDYLLAVNKPPGLLMHPSSIARDVSENLQDLLTNQLQTKIYLVHRIDRKTSGLVLIAKSSEMARKLSEQFANREVTKTYQAIARGHLLTEKLVQKELLNENDNLQSAETFIKPIKHAILPISTGKYESTRLTLVEAFPKTGRTHQIRRHLAHLRHYIVNDKPHGDCKLNKVFKDKLDYNHMMLHAKKIELKHPQSNKPLLIEAPFFKEFERLLLEF